MNEAMPRPHPAPETLAEFVDGGLVGSELKAVASHLRQCAECRDVVGETARFQAEGVVAEVVPIQRPAFRWWIPAAAAAAIVLAVIPFAGRFMDPLPRVQAKDRRMIQARLTGLDYAPYRPTRSAASEANSRQTAASAQLQGDLESKRSAKTLDRYAQAQLALGRTDSALDLLTEAARLEPNNAVVLSDLAAAQMAAGKIADAAENAARALERDPSFASAAFNWALALEELSNRPAAIKAWEKYLQLDSTSAWAAEAREELEKLRRGASERFDWERDREQLVSSATDDVLFRIVEHSPQRVRYWVLDDLIQRWNREQRAEDLTLARRIAVIRQHNGDRFLLDVIDRLSPGDRDLHDGIAAFGDARRAGARKDFDGAAVAFALAIPRLERSRSPLALAANIFAASTASYRGQGADAIARIESIDSQLEAYPSLASEAEWIRGLVLTRLGRNGDALRAYRRGLDFAVRAGETEHQAGLTSLLAISLDDAGDSNAVAYQVDALRHLEAIGASSQRMYVAYSATAFSHLRSRRPRTAISFIESQQAIASRERDPLLLAETGAARALAFRDVGDVERAVQALEAARQSGSRVTTEALRDRVQSDLDFIDGTLQARTNTSASIAALTSALNRWQKYDWRRHDATARLLLGDLRLQQRDRAGAEGEYRAGIAAMERERGSIDEPRLRVAYFERADALFERLITLLVDGKRYDEAFDITERKRARALLEAATRTGQSRVPAHSLNVAAVRKSIGSSTVLIELSLLSRGATIWSIDAQKVMCAQSVADGQTISDAAARFRAALERNDLAVAQREGRWLYDQLLAPASPQLAAAASIVIVPDDVLFSIPLGALVNESGEYLIERHSVVVAPSASLFALASSNDANRPGEVLSVAQPAPNGFPLLSRVREDIEAVSRLQPGARALIGSEISPPTFLRLCATASLISFAGHSTRDALVFESGKDHRPAFLTSGEIAEARLTKEPVVILAACGSGRGKLWLNEGVDSLATSFIAAGARAVVAAIWDVDDDSTSRLFVELHRGLSSGQLPGEALRSAQLSMLRSASARDRSPRSWAGMFVLMA